MLQLSLLFSWLLSVGFVLGTSDSSGVTPFGLRPKECIHGVRPGSHILNEPDHIVVTHPEYPNEFVRIPRCKRQHFNSNSTQTKDIEDVGIVNGDGWQQYVKVEMSDITAFLGKWTVPDAPADFGVGVLFTFTGLQNIDWVPPSPEPSQPFDIIQPVLQYGYSAAGGGLYWSMASWYVTLGSDVLYTALQRVDSKVVLFGNMTMTGSDTWYIDSVDTSNNFHANLTVSRSILTSQPWAYVTLEVYDIYSCTNYPKDVIPYTNLQIFVNKKVVTPQWEVGKSGQVPPICNSSISIADPSDVTIDFVA